jgi:hypothetical protein
MENAVAANVAGLFVIESERRQEERILFLIIALWRRLKNRKLKLDILSTALLLLALLLLLSLLLMNIEVEYFGAAHTHLCG